MTSRSPRPIPNHSPNNKLNYAALTRWAIVALLVLVVPVAAHAASVSFELVSGSATIRANLAGQSQSIFVPPTAIGVLIENATVVYDSDGGTDGRLESLSIHLADFSANLDETQVALDTIDVFDTTISSLSGSDLNALGQFATTAQISGIVEGLYPNGDPFGPAGVQSLDGTGSMTGLVNLDGGMILISVVGVSVGTFEQVGSQDPNASPIELKVDFTLVARATAPIPEPSGALLFMVGVTIVGSATRSALPR